MGKAKKTRKFAEVKRMLNPKDIKPPKPVKMEEEDEVRHVDKTPAALFIRYNTQLGPPYQVIIDTNFINFSIRNKIDLVKVTAVDKSAPAVMVYLCWGALVEQLLAWRRDVSCPLAPLPVAPTLSASHFGTAIKSVQDVLSKVEIRWELVVAATAAPPSGSTPNQ